MEHDTHTLATDAPTLETTLRLLCDQRRRSVVAVLSEREPPIALRDLSAAVASREAETESNDRSTDAIETVRTTLHHVHLPKLDENGIVDYDTETNAVTAARTEQLESIVSLPDGAG